LRLIIGSMICGTGFSGNIKAVPGKLVSTRLTEDERERPCRPAAFKGLFIVRWEEHFNEKMNNEFYFLSLGPPSLNLSKGHDWMAHLSLTQPPRTFISSLG